MNCEKFETIVSELARNQMMEADIRAEALAHTFKCSDCSDRMRDQKRRENRRGLPRETRDHRADDAEALFADRRAEISPGSLHLRQYPDGGGDDRTALSASVGDGRRQRHARLVLGRPREPRS